MSVDARRLLDALPRTPSWFDRPDSDTDPLADLVDVIGMAIDINVECVCEPQDSTRRTAERVAAGWRLVPPS